MECEVCEEEKNCPYKCPKCYLRYCSLPCWKTHKSDDTNCVPSETEGPAQPDGQSNERGHQTFVTDSTVPLDKLKLLGKSGEVKEALKNPHVRNIIMAIDKSNNPSASMQNAMLEPIFVEFADACLKVVEGCSEDDDSVSY